MGMLVKVLGGSEGLWGSVFSLLQAFCKYFGEFRDGFGK